MVVTRDPSRLCDYFIYDAHPVSVPSIAQDRDLELLETDEIHSAETIERLAAFAPEIIVLANYQIKVRKEITLLAARMAVNFHPSPLPRYAGLAPFFWMARNGETDVAVSCCLVSDKLDGGDIVHQLKVSLTGEETSGETREKLFEATFRQVTIVFDMLGKGPVETIPQALSERTYFGKPSDADRTIDWFQPTDTVMRWIRASTPPGAITLLPSGEQVRILEAQRFRLDHRAAPGTVSYDQGLPVIHTGDGAVGIISYAGCGPPEQQARRLEKNGGA